jgi:hypothetical protein
MVQSALDAFTTQLTENYPLGIHADSVQVTYDGVTAHYSNRDASNPQGNQAMRTTKGTTTTRTIPASNTSRP